MVTAKPVAGRAKFVSSAGVAGVRRGAFVSSETQNFSVWGFIKGFGKLLIGLLLVLQGIIGLVVLILFVGIISAAMNGVAGSKDAGVKVPEGAALVLNPNGVLVEQAGTCGPL